MERGGQDETDERVRRAVHDLNNVMLAMGSMVALMRRRLASGENVTTYLDEIEGLLKRSQAIVRELG